MFTLAFWAPGSGIATNMSIIMLLLLLTEAQKAHVNLIMHAQVQDLHYTWLCGAAVLSLRVLKRWTMEMPLDFAAKNRKHKGK